MQVTDAHSVVDVVDAHGAVPFSVAVGVHVVGLSCCQLVGRVARLHSLLYIIKHDRQVGGGWRFFDSLKARCLDI